MKKLLLAFLLLALCGGATLQAAPTFPFRDTTRSVDARLDNLISLLTRDEKIAALSTNLGVARLGIRNTGQSEGLHGMALGGPGNWGGMKMVNSRPVPDIYPTTIFPQAYGLGETWDTELLRKVADIEATEIRFYTQNVRYGKGGLVMRAPNADLARDPRWGRTEESYGEDPYLTGSMVQAFVHGLQGDNPRQWKAASLMKHFLANSNEDGRDSTSSNFDQRLFHEYYAYPFRKGIEAGARAFMASYNSWNGTPMVINPVLDRIRRAWNMQGIICTDGGALGLLIRSHKAFATLPEGAAAIIKAGVGEFLDTYRPAVEEALQKGLLTEADIDKVIRGNFYVALKLGLLDDDPTSLPYADIGVRDTVAPWRKPETRAFVRRVTDESVVLLKNTGLLPLDTAKIHSVAVIGPRADEVLFDWYSGTPDYAVTILQGIKNAVGSGVEVLYVPSDDRGQAYAAARKADVAVVCIGNHVYGTDPKWLYSPVPSDGREAVDRKALTLEQEDLAKTVFQANPRTVLVLVSSFPFAIDWSQRTLPAIVHVTQCSEELGNGVADVLFGKYNPAGRTTQTWVRSIADLPPMMDYNIRDGRTYMYFRGEPLYPFGYGLSYTTFAYSDLKCSAASLSEQKPLDISVTVTNTGARDGDEVVQLYVAFPHSDVVRPIRQLKGFRRVAVAKAEHTQVHFTLSAEDLSYWDETKKDWVVEPGRVEISIGASSADLRLHKTIQLL